MRFQTMSIGVVALLALGGCATSSISYVPPVEQKVVNSATVDKSFDEVWDRLVRQLSSDFFVINNIDKNSRLINVSFSSQRPSEYVDCGVSTRTFKNARGDQTYTYKTAESANFSTTNNQGIVFNVNRTTKLDGRINIYVAPEAGRTLVNVNTKYIVGVTMNVVSVDGRPAGNPTTTFDFSTKQGYITSEVSCHALGKIEQRILDFAKN